MNRIKRTVVQALRNFTVVSAVILTPSANAALFTGIGHLPNLTQSGVYLFPGPAISTDGRVVVGTSGGSRTSALDFDVQEAFRWTMETGVVGLGFTHATDVSADGTVVVGEDFRSVDGLGHPMTEALRWTAPSELEEIGEGFSHSRATGVSSDGSVVVGYESKFLSDVLGQRAFRWTEENGVTRLGVPDFGDGTSFVTSFAFRVSGDGGTIIGYSLDENRDGSWSHAAVWRWTDQDGFLDLGYLPSLTQRPQNGWATDLTPDGSIIVGTQYTESTGEQPFRWTEQTGMLPLSGWEGHDVRGFPAVSANGAFIVGSRSPRGDGSDITPFIWDEQNGVRDLKEVLTSEFSLEDQMSGWEELIPTDISGDGHRIVGAGINPAGDREAWIAILEPDLQAGDADQDSDFDQLDLVQVQIASKYLSGQNATWGEGDWNGAPGGIKGRPPAGDGVFDQRDVIAALSTGNYLTGPYAAIKTKGDQGHGPVSLIYHAESGELEMETAPGNDLTSISIVSSEGLFHGEPPNVLDGSFDIFAADNLFKATFGASFGSTSFGNVLEPNLSEDVLATDLIVTGSLAASGDIGKVDLIYLAVPEPASSLLLLYAIVWFCAHGLSTRRLTK